MRLLFLSQSCRMKRFFENHDKLRIREKQDMEDKMNESFCV